MLLKLLQSKKGKYLRSLIRPFLAIPRNKTYIFILGCYNSGTTFLEDILKNHPEISSLPREGVALTDCLPVPEDCIWPRLWIKCENQLREEIANIQENQIANIKKDWSLFFDSRKRFWLQKSVANSLMIDFLENNFDNPWFIWIVRNGYAVAEGIRRRAKQSRYISDEFKDKGYPIEWCIKQWIETNKTIENKRNRVSRIVKITYEDLTDNFDSTVNSLINWLPVRSKDTPNFSSFKFHGQSREVKNMNKGSIGNLKKEDIERINAVGAEDIKHWGYSVIDTRGAIL